MKLRIRSQQTKETLKLEIPNNCTFHQFKKIIFQQVSSPSSSSSETAAVSEASSSSSSSASRCVSVSLNNKNEIFGAPNDSLQSLGITSGDLVFYSYNPSLVADERNLRDAGTGNVSVRELGEMSKSDVDLVDFRDPEIEYKRQHVLESGELETLETCTDKGHLSLSSREINEMAKSSDVGLVDIHDPGTLGIQVEQQQLFELEVGRNNLDGLRALDSGKTVMESEIVDMDEEDDADVDHSEALDFDTESKETMEGDYMEDRTTGSVPCFLRKVLKDELSECGSARRLSVIALHAVLLDSGFVQFNPKSNIKIDNFHVLEDWPSMSLWYTLPVLICNGSDIIESVVLKLQSLGRNTIVYGSLTRNGSQVHTIRLKERRFAPTFDLIWASKSDSINETSDSKRYLEKEVFEFWKLVKDGLALPLLIDLCERAGCELPPCLTQLPTDLKLMILDHLPGVDLAKVACVSSELRYMSSNDDLWKQKYKEEFGDVQMYSRGVTIWKSRFAQAWVFVKAPKMVPQIWPPYPRPARRHFVPPGIFPPDTFGAPRIMGGDYDIWPDTGISHRFWTRSSRPMTKPLAQRISSNCNLRRRRNRQ